MNLLFTDWPIAELLLSVVGPVCLLRPAPVQRVQARDPTDDVEYPHMYGDPKSQVTSLRLPIYRRTVKHVLSLPAR